MAFKKMNKAIYKYELQVNNFNNIQMPEGATILKVAEAQTGMITLWAEVTKNNPMTTRAILTRGTGHSFSDKNRGDYIDTIVMRDNIFVWHVMRCPGASLRKPCRFVRRWWSCICGGWNKETCNFLNLGLDLCSGRGHKGSIEKRKRL